MEFDQNLYIKLVELRNQLKEKEKRSTGRTPVICSDEALEQIAKYKPRTPNEFECIAGLGKVFQEKYGEVFSQTIIKYADKGFATKMGSDISKTLKELEKNLITLNKKNRLLYSCQLRNKDGFDMFYENPEDALKLLFGKKHKLVIKNNDNLETLRLEYDDQKVRRNQLSHYKKITAILRDINKDYREKGQNNLYIAYPFVKGKLRGEDFNVRAPLAFFPVKAEKNSLQITLSMDNSRDVIVNNALILANFKFSKIKKPLPNPAIEADLNSPQELFHFLEEFYQEQEIVLKRDPNSHPEKSIALDEDFSIKEFTLYKTDEFPEFKKGELYIEDSMVLGRYQICSSTIQKDFDALIERKESTVQMDKLLKSFDQALMEASEDNTETSEGLSPVIEKDLTYINSLNSSQEEVLTSMNQLDQLVVQGPPGTGKSQTITSLIVDYILKDKTVLLVSEKKTALDVVYSRLGPLSRYALLIDDISNKADFYEQIQGMVTTANDTKGRNEDINKPTQLIQTDIDKLQSIADSIYKSKTIGAPTYLLYQNSSKIDLSNYNQSLELINVQEKFSELLKIEYPALMEIKTLFDDETYGQQTAFFVQSKLENPWLLSIKSEISDLDVMKIKAAVDSQKETILQWQEKGFFQRLFSKSKTLSPIKKSISDLVANNKFYSAVLKSPEAVSSHITDYKDFHIAKSQYEKLDKFGKSYIAAICFLKKEGQTFSFCNDKLFNILLNIHLSKFEASNTFNLKNIEQYRSIIRHITDTMGEKRKITINNTAVKLADYMDGLTESKRRNEINRTLESSRKISVSKFLTKYKMEIFDSIKIWMLTPEVVSELIPLQQGIFDLVIFDEASQMFVEKGIPSIFRAKKVVVAGDSKQLRPMKLFQGRFENDPEDESEIQETEANEALEEQSLLDLARFKYDTVMLKYHYRSKYEELIAFSNHAFYKGQLLVSPNAINSEEPPIQVHKIDDGIWVDTANKKEAMYCVQLVKKIFKERKNNETIGIITFNAHQHDIIEDCLDMECMADKDFENALSIERTRKENGEDVSLFVKSIENVQGDERDIIIFSVGFAKNPDGKIYRNYGWLNNEGGENRLNVAISRAKSKIHIVTSVHPSELVVDDLKHDGPKYLKKYLEYCFAVDSSSIENAKNILSNLSNKTEDVTTIQNNQIFKTSICEALTKEGYEIDTDVGIGGYSIDIAIKKGNNYVLGIECDSSLYENSSETRERDFHRQRFLESRGWIVYRMWSSCWWKDPSEQIKIIKELINE